jgi:type IX secretion system PorP/SprF family membrane protein
MKKILLFLIVLTCVVGVNGQSPGPFLRQFSANPYLFNPAYVAINDKAEANLFYRKQWVNFEDAPVTSGFSLQYPTNSRVLLGFNLTSDTQVLLKNTTVMGTFGYVIPISDKESLRFGISGGIGINRLDLSADELNTNDPAIINAANNNSYVDGNVGVVYTYGGLRLGFALTEIFESDPFNAEKFSEFKLSNLRNRLFSASYRFDVGLMKEFSLEPYALYRQSQDGLQDYWEAATMVYYKDKIWGGASYNQNNGVGLFLGLNVMDKFRFSYSYEFPPVNADFTSTSSHELHMGFAFGQKKSRAVVSRAGSYKKTVAKNKKTIQKDMKEDQKAAEKVAQEAISEPAELAAEGQLAVLAADGSDPVPVTQAFKEGAPPRSEILEPGSYVIVGAFSVSKYAYRFARQVNAKGYTSTVALNPDKDLYYIYIFSSYDVEEAKKVRQQYVTRNLFKDAWIFTMQ